MFLSQIFFFNFLRRKIFVLTSFYAKNVFTVNNILKKKKIAHENMKKPTLKVAEPAQISIPVP